MFQASARKCSVSHLSPVVLWSFQMSRETKIVFLGASQVGKTALVSGVLGGQFPEDYFPTVEDRYHKQYVFGSVRIHVELVDTSGAPEFAAVTNYQMISGDAFVVVYSVCSRSSFDAAKQLLRDLCTMKTGDARDCGSVPIVLVGSQADSEAGTRRVSYQEGCALAKLYGQPAVLETSALKGDNVQCVISRILERFCKGASPVRKRPSVMRRLSRKASKKWRKSIAF